MEIILIVKQKKYLQQKRIDIIPIINEKKELIDILEWSDFLDQKPTNDFDLKDTPVVIMAGGRGSRLEPFTSVLPKASYSSSRKANY